MLELRDLLLQENKHFIIIIWTQSVSYSVRCLLERNCHNIPKVLSTPFRAQVMALSVFSPPAGSQESLLCPIRALKMYIERSALYRKSEQLFVGFGNHAKGGPVMKQRISRWLVDANTLA